MDGKILFSFKIYLQKKEYPKAKLNNPFNILIHKMLDDDHGEGVHNHLCPYITIILKGPYGYWETICFRTNKGKFKKWFIN